MTDPVGAEGVDGKPRASSPVSGTIVVILVAYAILAFLVLCAAFRFTNWSRPDTSLRDFTALVAVGLSAVSAVAGFAISFVTLRRNQQAAIGLELLKSQLQEKVENAKAELQGNLEVIKSDLQSKVFSKKIWTDLRFEYEKLKSTTETAAYAKLWTSIDSTYSSLAKLETGSWSAQDRVQMDSALLEARGQLAYMRNRDHQTSWEKARQRARDISERAAKVDPSGQRALWEENMPEFATRCADFKEIAAAEINRLPSSQAAVEDSDSNGTTHS